MRRGAAVANLIGARLDDGTAGTAFAAVKPTNVYAYTFATFWGMLTACVVGMLFVPPLYVFFRRLAGVKG